MEEIKRQFVVGLGNPGREYADTRHNIGFMVIKELRDRWNLDSGKESFESICWNFQMQRINNGKTFSKPITMIAPMTFMNCSGRAVSSMLKFYKAQPEDMLVIYDDLALPTAQLRCRANGSAGGHNGIADIIKACGTDCIARLRIGIDNPPTQMDAKHYVLGKFGKQEKIKIETAVRNAADATEDWIFNNTKIVMEKYNSNKQESEV